MKPIQTTLLLCVFCAVASLAAAAQTPSSIGYFDTIANDPDVRDGETYYLRHNIMYEGRKWDATNYWRGTLLPINTKVTLVYIAGDTFKISWAGGKLTIVNSVGFTRRLTYTIAKHMLSPNPVPIEQFDKEMADNIRAGKLVLGMTREQVIMTRGFPPGHKTPDIMAENGRWMYWTSRLVVHTLAIKDGKLEAGRGLSR